MDAHRHLLPNHRSTRTARAACGMLAVALVASVAALVAAPSPASAGGIPFVAIEVTTTDDVVDPADGVLSLREAVDLANTDGDHSDVILAVGTTYQLDDCAGGVDEQANVGGDLDHTADDALRISGNGSTIEQTCAGERVLHHWQPAGQLWIDRVRITGGDSAGSGGGVHSGFTLTVSGSLVEGNRSTHANGGGGVFSVFDLNVSRSTIRDNSSAGAGGGGRSFEFVGVQASTVVGNDSGASGGGISAGTKLNVQRSTVTGNQAATFGGGVSSTSDDAELGGSTVVANRAPVGANVHADEAVILDRSIVALGSGGPDCDSDDPVDNGGANVGYDPSCGAAAPLDAPAVHPMVGPLAHPDGPLEVNSFTEATQTRRPVVGSPVLDRSPAPCHGDVDQHGTARPQGPGCDSGSFEGPAEVCAPAFSDVSAVHPFFEEICWLDQAGITGGYADGSFGASNPVSRQAMAAFLYRLALEPPVPVSLVAFSDVGAGHPFAQEIVWLLEQDITEGYGDNTFRPNEPVSRQAMAAFLYRVAGEPGLPAIPAPTFPDVPFSHPFAREVEWMASAGVSNGYDDGTWRPSDPVTRQAMAAFLQRMAEDVDLRGL